jgi:hypothetical protein
MGAHPGLVVVSGGEHQISPLRRSRLREMASVEMTKESGGWEPSLFVVDATRCFDAMPRIEAPCYDEEGDEEAERGDGEDRDGSP